MLWFWGKEKKKSTIKSSRQQETSSSGSLTGFCTSFPLPHDYCDPTTSLRHLLEKKVNGWVKNLGVIHPNWSQRFSPLLYDFMSHTPFYHTSEDFIIIIPLWRPSILFHTYHPQNLYYLSPDRILILVKHTPKQQNTEREKTTDLHGHALHLWPKSQVGI